MKLLFILILSSFIGLSQNTSLQNIITILKSMVNENQIYENSIYVIIGIPKESLDSLKNNVEYVATLSHINGTCFFISPNKFITAHHVLNKVFAEKQVYFLINKYCNIISEITINQEEPEHDLCVGMIDTVVDTFYKIPKSVPVLKQSDQFIAYGFSSKDNKNFNIKIIKENNKVRLIEHNISELKKIRYKFIKAQMLENHLSNDEIPINLKKCNVFIFDTPLELGFSGGPTFNLETNEVIGFASQDACVKDKDSIPIMLIIPISEN